MVRSWKRCQNCDGVQVALSVALFASLLCEPDAAQLPAVAGTSPVSR